MESSFDSQSLSKYLRESVDAVVPPTNESLGLSYFSSNNSNIDESHPIPSQILNLILNAIDAEPSDLISFDQIDDWDSLSYSIFHASFEVLCCKSLI